MRAFRAVAATELRLATRNVDMILFGVVFPIGILLVTGWISDPQGLRLHFAGIVCFGICAAGLMMLPLTIADYRHRKVLKRFRVTPASPAMLLGAAVLVACVYVVISATAVCLIAGFGFGVRVDGGATRFVLAFLLVQTAVFGLGALVGGVSPNAKVANALASALYFPMILLSGVAVPFELFPRPLRIAAEVLPVTQGVALLKAVVVGDPWTDMIVPVAVLVAVGGTAYGVAVSRFRWE